MRAPFEDILTERLRLRLAQPEDAEALFLLFDNWNVVRWLTGPPWPVTLDGMRTHLRKCLNEGIEHEEMRLIEHSGNALGIVGWGYRGAAADMREDGPNVGYWLGESYWGKGFMSEAARALVKHIFASTDISAIRSGIIEGNEASLRIQQKIGFVVSRYKSSFSNPLGKDIPAIDTILTRAAFEKAHA